jgi:hypothetical protein
MMPDLNFESSTQRTEGSNLDAPKVNVDTYDSSFHIDKDCTVVHWGLLLDHGFQISFAASGKPEKYLFTLADL